ncbi:dihydrofolate reductase [Sphaerotilus mobilis]|uniref:Dihydrofolate reductase n=1 Tax=Sphaerotilus mobilis TaxID=47994 RepID=A0A4Q7LUQ6_9BURK|nr:dihydrofolate reductase [Sphaerotilus mobilis]RZS58133.1 dihydrofolate reductase [Sphaerotilus mobilis]
MSPSPTRPEIVLIAALARNGTIGADNQLLWHLPEDLAHFRRLTTGRPVLMGRKTWDSLPARFRPLPGRHNIVLTRDPHWRAEGATAVTTLDKAWAAASAAGPVEQVFVIGGAQLYAATIAQADRLELTVIERDYDGDVRFPALDPADWRERSREHHQAGAPNDFGYAFVSLQRVRAD